ncbi:MAG: hypothetical protein ACO3C1_02430 [Ilumatobacteraceae bacterium]
MIDEGRAARLNAIKLSALVRDHLAASTLAGSSSGAIEAAEFAGGAAVRHGDEGWVLVADRSQYGPSRGLGGALAWAVRHDVARLHVVVDEGEGGLARRAAGFALPVSVWRAEGRALVAAVAAPLPHAAEVPPHHRQFEDVIVAAGAEPTIEHGVLAGEVVGLEVCRVVDDAYSGTTRLEVGVGTHDREAFLMLHGDRPTSAALAEVVAAVRAHRTDPASGHPLARLARERLLRAVVVADPALVGASRVEPVPPPEPRANLKDPVPCTAVAHDARGGRTVLVFTTGIDLDAVPTCIDARTATGIDQCELVLPTRDAIDLQHRLAALAVPPVTLRTIDIASVHP